MEGARRFSRLGGMEINQQVCNVQASVSASVSCRVPGSGAMGAPILELLPLTRNNAFSWILAPSSSHSRYHSAPGPGALSGPRSLDILSYPTPALPVAPE